MRGVPHHSSNHLNLNWKDFVTKEWTMPRLKRDLEIEDKETVVCSIPGFKYHEINSCMKGTRADPVYLQL